MTGKGKNKGRGQGQNQDQESNPTHFELYNLTVQGLNLEELDIWIADMNRPIDQRAVAHEIEGAYIQWPGLEKAFPNLKEQTVESAIRGQALTHSMLEHLKREHAVEPINKAAYRILVVNLLRALLSSVDTPLSALVIVHELEKILKIVRGHKPAIMLQEIFKGLLKDDRS